MAAKAAKVPPSRRGKKHLGVSAHNGAADLLTEIVKAQPSDDAGRWSIFRFLARSIDNELKITPLPTGRMASEIMPSAEDVFPEAPEVHGLGIIEASNVLSGRRNAEHDEIARRMEEVMAPAMAEFEADARKARQKPEPKKSGGWIDDDSLPVLDL